MDAQYWDRVRSSCWHRGKSSIAHKTVDLKGVAGTMHRMGLGLGLRSLGVVGREEVPCGGGNRQRGGVRWSIRASDSTHFGCVLWRRSAAAACSSRGVRTDLSGTIARSFPNGLCPPIAHDPWPPTKLPPYPPQLFGGRGRHK